MYKYIHTCTSGSFRFSTLVLLIKFNRIPIFIKRTGLPHRSRPCPRLSDLSSCPETTLTPIPRPVSAAPISCSFILKPTWPRRPIRLSAPKLQGAGCLALSSVANARLWGHGVRGDAAVRRARAAVGVQHEPAAWSRRANNRRRVLASRPLRPELRQRVLAVERQRAVHDRGQQAVGRVQLPRGDRKSVV